VSNEVEVPSQGMGKNVIPFRRRKGATDSEKAASRGSRIIVRLGRQRYAIDMSCAARALAAETDPRLRSASLEFSRWRPSSWDCASRRSWETV
jgi:hypothetical protein